jgi:putative addiction module component (TIGR02574 family)
MSFEDFKREALRMSFDEREELAHALYDSLDEDEDMDAAAVLPEEVKRRYQAYKEGKTQPITLEELLAGLD